MMNYTNAHSPKFAENGTVLLTVGFDGIGEVPFNASPNDTEAHGRELYARAIAGEFGPVEPYVTPVVIPQVPQVVTMRQARLALLAANLLTGVNAAVAAGTEADRINWEFASEVRRDSPLVASITLALGKTEQEIDALFILASTL